MTIEVAKNLSKLNKGNSTIIDMIFEDFEKQTIEMLVEAVDRGYSKAVKDLESRACETCSFHRNCNMESAWREVVFCKSEAYGKYIKPYSCSVWEKNAEQKN